MSEDDDSEFNVKLEIQKILQLINNDTIKVQRELKAICDLVKNGGVMQDAVQTANEKLQTMAENLGISVDKILAEDDASSEHSKTNDKEDNSKTV